MDGVELAGAIRAAPSLRSAAIVMVSSPAPPAVERGSAEHRRPPHQAGAAGKPARGGRRGAGAPGAAAGERRGPSPRPCGRARRARLLVAEDNPVNQLVIRGMLAKRGYGSDMVPSAARRSPALDRSVHAAVLMDVQMPGLDGYEATAPDPRARARRRALPIIAMTAGAMEGDRERASARAWTTISPSPCAPTGSTRCSSAGSATSAHRPGARRSQRLIDVARIRMLQRDYPDIVDRLVALFADSTPPLLEQIADASAQRRRGGVRRRAHKLKGSCDNVGASRMARLCRAPGGAGTPAPAARRRAAGGVPGDARGDPRRRRCLAR